MSSRDDIERGVTNEPRLEQAIRRNNEAQERARKKAKSKAKKKKSQKQIDEEKYNQESVDRMGRNADAMENVFNKGGIAKGKKKGCDFPGIAIMVKKKK